MDAREVLESLMWTLGPSVVCTYVWLYYVMYYTPIVDTYAKRSRLWALFGDHHGPYRWLWLASVVVSVVAFLHLSVWLCYFGGAAEELAAHDWVVYPYGLFLVFSALYAPLMLFAWPWVVVVDLACAAASAIALCAWTVLYLKSAEGIATGALTCWLAFHCTVLDGMLWSYSWCYRRGYWTEDDQWVEAPNYY